MADYFYIYKKDQNNIEVDTCIALDLRLVILISFQPIEFLYETTNKHRGH
jgi:hypothetical protein